MKNLINAFDNRDIYEINGKGSYLVTTFTDHIPSTSPEVLKLAIKIIAKKITPYLKNTNKIVGEEERGGYLAVCTALKTNLPFCLAKQNPSNVPGEIGVSFIMAYRTDMTMYFNGLTKYDKVIIIDDIIDSGGTIITMIKTLQNMGVEIIKIVALAERLEKGGVKKIKKETGYDVETIIKVDTSGKKSVVVNKKELLSI